MASGYSGKNRNINEMEILSESSLAIQTVLHGVQATSLYPQVNAETNIHVGISYKIVVIIIVNIIILSNSPL